MCESIFYSFYASKSYLFEQVVSDIGNFRNIQGILKIINCCIYHIIFFTISIRNNSKSYAKFTSTLTLRLDN